LDLLHIREGLNLNFHRVAWNAQLSGLTMRILSVKRMHCDKTEERSVQIFIPCERSFTLLLWQEEWLVRGGRRTPSTWNFRSTGHRWSEIADFEPIFARSASAITHIEEFN